MKDLTTHKRWKKCHELVLAIFQTSTAFPENDAGVMGEELRETVLLLQLSLEDAILRRRRVAQGRPRPLDVANGKLARLESSLMMCRDFKYIDSATYKRLMGMAEDVQKDIDGMLGKRAVRARNLSSARFVKWANAITSKI